MSRSNRTFAPRLETLDDRTVPAVVSSFANGTLTITGDAGDNRVFAGVVGNKLVVISEDGFRTFGNASALTAVNADLGGGNDTLRLGLGASLGRNDNLAVAVDGGEGNDRVVVSALAVGRDATLTTDIDTGTGDDRVGFSLGAVGWGATTNTTVNLGDGDDVFNWTGRVTGRDAVVNLDLDAGLGGDTVTTNLGRFGRTGALTGAINLGADAQGAADADADTLTLISGNVGFGTTAAIGVDAAVTGAVTDTITDTNLSSDVTVNVNDLGP